MDIQKEREAFEAWLKSLNENGRTTYFLGQESTVAWEAWQAAKAQVPEGFVLVPKEFNEKLAEKMAAEMVNKPIPENDPVWIEIANKAYKDNLLMKKWEIIRNYKAMIEAAQGEGHE